MLRVLLFFTHLCLFVNSDEVPVEIQIDIPKGQMYFEDPSTKVALLDHPLDIVIKDFHATDVHCWDKSNHMPFEISFNNQKIINGKKSLIIQVEDVGIKMSALWDCIVTNQGSDRYKKSHIVFKLHVKDAKTLDATINGTPVNFNLTDITETKYDGIANYWYENGETIDLLCRDLNKKGQLRIRYEDAKGEEVFRSNGVPSVDSVYFSGMMMKHNDYDKIDCILIFRHITYTYRIIFKSKAQTSESFFEISINNQRLVPTQRSEDKYQYKFFNDEELEVSCKKAGEQTPGDIIFLGDERIVNSIRDVTVSRWKRTIKFSTKDLEKNHLKCLFKNEPPIKPYKRADILFMRDEKDPYIAGLSQQAIVYQYSANDTTWVTHYNYDVGDKVYLTCASKKDHLQIYGDDIHFQNLLKPNEVKNLSYDITLNSEHDGKTITCESKKGRKIYKAVISLYENKIIPVSPHKEEDLILIISCSVTGLLIIIMAVCFAFWWSTSKKKNTAKDSCENLVHQFESPITTFPSQWSNRARTNGVMLENSFYNGGPAYAYPHRRENTNSVEYHYIEVNDDIMKKHNELLKEHMAQMINESIAEGGNDSDYIQPYATSTLQGANTNEEYKSATNKRYSYWNNSQENPLNHFEDQNELTNKQKQVIGRQSANNWFNNETDMEKIGTLQTNSNISYSNLAKDFENDNKAGNNWYNNEIGSEKIGTLQPNTNISYSNVKKDVENSKQAENYWYNSEMATEKNDHYK